MTGKRDMLRHFLAALAYRLQKALRNMPETLPEFRAGQSLAKLTSLLCVFRDYKIRDATCDSTCSC